MIEPLQQNPTPTEQSPSSSLSTNQDLHKLTSFIEYHNISSEQLWGTNTQLTITQFANLIQQKFGYHVTFKQLLALKKIAEKQERLFVENFHTLGIWTDVVHQAENFGNFNYTKSRVRPQTANNKSQSRISKLKDINQSSITQKLCHSGTQAFIKNSRIKQNDEMQKKKILQNALDKKWEYLIKVGQMNAWKKEVKVTDRPEQSKTNIRSSIANKVYKIQDQQEDIKIIEEKQNGDAEVLPLKVFDQKYQSMKKKIFSQEKLKNNMKGTMLMVLDKKDKISKAKLGERISQRDQELNYLLLEVMRTKNIFEQQEQILAQCGVNM